MPGLIMFVNYVYWYAAHTIHGREGGVRFVD